MSPSTKHTSVQLKEIIQDEKHTDQGAREVQEHVGREEDLNPDNTSSVLNTVLNSINNEFKYEFPDEAVRLLNAHPICQSTDDCVPGHKYPIPDLPGTNFWAPQVWAILFDCEEVGLGFSYLRGAGGGWNGSCHILSPRWQQQWYAHCWVRKFKWGYHCRFCGGIPLESGLILHRMTFPGLSAINGSGICYGDRIQFPATFQRSSQLHCRGIHRLHRPLNQSWWWQGPELRRRSRVSSTGWHMEPISKSITCCTRNIQISPKGIWSPVLMSQNSGWNIHIVSYDSSTSRAKPSSNGQLTHCSWSIGIFDESHR